jgi:hypothetical protein
MQGINARSSLLSRRSCGSSTCSSSASFSGRGTTVFKSSGTARARALSARPGPRRSPARLSPAAAAAASSSDSYDDFSDYDEGTYSPVDARSFILEKSGLVDYYSLL